MDLKQIEREVIESIRNNIEESGDEIPFIAADTVLLDGIEGFDSLRAIEVLISLEDAFECELPPEKVFLKKPPEKDTIGDITRAIKNIVEVEDK